jgi:transposase-like protein
MATAQTARKRVTPEFCDKIRELSPALRQAEIAQKLGCATSTVGKVLRRFRLPETAGEETLIVIRASKAMARMASMRSLSLSAYLLQLVDADTAELRLSQLPPSVFTNGKNVDHENHAGKKARILEMLEEGLSVRVIAERNDCGKSTVRRFRDSRE